MMHQAPMLSAPLKQTQEIDWIHPLKAYIRDQYGDDPERYSEECSTLNRLRQDMRGAGRDSASGRDLLYRYYGQLELLDLRFPVDEHHIKISFTWFDAFTHKSTSQYSLAFEKASIIFNISAVLSSHASIQNRHEDTGLKTAYHSFQAAAGMFTYINENFLHAPSTDLSRETVKTLIQLMLAQGQEVFLEKQIADDKKVGLLAKLASQAAYLYGQAMEGVQENIKANHMAATAQYYQAMADDDANAHGTAISRLQVAESQAKEAQRLVNSFPANPPVNSNLTGESGQLLGDIIKRHLANIQEKIIEFSKDNDFIYHQPIPGDGTLQAIPKLPAAKAIPVSELYQGQDIQRIIGPDIFQRIVPMAVTESASLYDEEKAKLVRAEAERVEIANDEMAASLDYLKLPQSLDVLKGAKDPEIGVDAEFRRWCEDLAGHQPFNSTFERLTAERNTINSILDQCVKSMDMEETVCEKMRSKYGDDWTQQPSSRQSATLRTDTRNYRQVVEEASNSDAQLYNTLRQNESDFDEMRSAGETDEADVLYQRAMIKAGAGRGKGKASSSPFGEGNLLDEDFDTGPSVADQIAGIEELLKKLRLVRKEREQVLKDLKERIHNDDISNVLILNKKSISNQDNQIFKAELEKFRPHQNRILQANHKQTSLLKDLTRTYDTLLQDKRVRAEQGKFEAFSRQRNTVLQRYRKVYQAFNDLSTGLQRAEQFYREMRETVESLQKNVDSFVSNRRNEGSQLLTGIEALRSQSKTSGLVDWERERLQEIMGRMDINQNGNGLRSNQPPPPSLATAHKPSPITSVPYASPPPLTSTASMGRASNGSAASYNPNTYGPLSPPLPGHHFQPASQHQQSHRQSQPYYSSPPLNSQTPNQYQQQPAAAATPPQIQHRQSYHHHHHQQPSSSSSTSMPPGWQPPPPPPGPPPSQQDYNFGLSSMATSQGSGNYPNGPGGYASQQTRRPGNAEGYGVNAPQGQQGSVGDPWSGLSGWK